MSEQATTQGTAASVTATPVSSGVASALSELITIPSDLASGVTARLHSDGTLTVTLYAHQGHDDKRLAHGVEVEPTEALRAALQAVLDAERATLHSRVRADVVEHILAMRGGV